MKNGNLKLFVVSDFLSQFGSGMCLGTVSWFVIDMTGKNTSVSSFYNINIISGLLTAFFLATLIDKYKCKNMIMFTLIFRAFLLGLSYLLIHVYDFKLEFVYLIAMSNGVGWNLYLPASKKMIPLICDNNLMKINSFAETTLQVGMFSAGAIAGFLYKFIGFQYILIINIACFLFSAIVVWNIKLTDTVVHQEMKNKNNLSHIVRYIYSNKIILLLGIVMYLPFVAATCINVALPGYVNDILKGDSIVFGIYRYVL